MITTKGFLEFIGHISLFIINIIKFDAWAFRW